MENRPQSREKQTKRNLRMSFMIIARHPAMTAADWHNVM
jgi:hypothetical protein